MTGRRPRGVARTGKGVALADIPAAGNLRPLISAAREMQATRRLASPTAISAHFLSKSFRLPHEHYSTVRERFVHPFASRTYERLDALRGVSFDVQSGEFFGVVGKNG